MQSQQEMDIDTNSYSKLVTRHNQFNIQSESLIKIHPISDNSQSEIILVIPFDEQAQAQYKQQDQQVRKFSIKILSLWALQISFQLILNIMTINIFVFWPFLYISLIISSVIIIHTAINNNPKYQLQSNTQDKMLFFIVFIFFILVIKRDFYFSLFG